MLLVLGKDDTCMGRPEFVCLFYEVGRAENNTKMSLDFKVCLFLFLFAFRVSQTEVWKFEWIVVLGALTLGLGRSKHCDGDGAYMMVKTGDCASLSAIDEVHGVECCLPAKMPYTSYSPRMRSREI